MPARAGRLLVPAAGLWQEPLHVHRVRAPGGYMPPHGHEDDPYELSFFMLDGELEIMLDGDTFTVTPGEAIHIDPTVSLGVRNRGTRVASFLLTFNPPPPITSLDALRERYATRGDGVKSAADMEALLTR
ncbi:MAG: cupin domain-containing protein [Armatimonadota bacterium]|nr:cupin domain-containing protein [Armatimonadota bacterium]